MTGNSVAGALAFDPNYGLDPAPSLVEHRVDGVMALDHATASPLNVAMALFQPFCLGMCDGLVTAPAADIACLDTAALRDNAAIRNLITVSKWTPGRVFLHDLGLLLSDKAYQNLWFNPRFVWFVDASRRLLRGGLAGKQDG